MSEHITDWRYDIGNGTYSIVKHEEVVRCRDCKYYNAKLTDEDDGTSWCCIHAGYAFEDDFCAWGERR